ncbi:MAG: DUF6183 family protein [Actinomycetota bacterium]
MRGYDDLIEAQDFNGLLRAVDAACEARSWDELIDLAESCEAAIERGKQLWPIATHIDYRLALEAPAEYAAPVLHSDVGRFAAGPLTEVVASTHTWEELVPHIEAPHLAAYVAQERVLRGELLTGDGRAHAEILELPLSLQPWEPTYALARFRSTFVEVAEPWVPKAALRPLHLRPGALQEDQELTEALLDLVQPWTAESNGAARAVAAEGDAPAAVSHLAFDGARIGELSLAEGFQRMAWAAAAGGAHGRRRGAALGRFLAWYTAALIAGCSWPPEPGELEASLDDVRWYRWDEGAEEDGWVLRLAVEHQGDGWAAALGATDVLEDLDGVSRPPKP